MASKTETFVSSHFFGLGKYNKALVLQDTLSLVLVHTSATASVFPLSPTHRAFLIFWFWFVGVDSSFGWPMSDQDVQFRFDIGDLQDSLVVDRILGAIPCQKATSKECNCLLKIRGFLVGRQEAGRDVNPLCGQEQFLRILHSLEDYLVTLGGVTNLLAVQPIASGFIPIFSIHICIHEWTVSHERFSSESNESSRNTTEIQSKQKQPLFQYSQ